MSYNNNWSISGISGLTSLKDCYQWNGEKRLYTVGMLRKKNINKNDSAVFPFLTRVPIRIDDNETAYGPSINNSTLRYMGIPRYYINENTLYGIGVDDQYREDNNFRYTNVTLRVEREESRMPTFGFLQYPTIIPFLDSFSDWTVDQISPSNITIVGNVYYDKSNAPAKWVVKTEEPANKSKFFIASYYHTQLPMNDPSTDIYHIYWSEGTTDIRNKEMDFYNDITLKLYGSGSPTSLSLVNANGVTGSAQEYRYLDALFFSKTISSSCTTSYRISWKDTVESTYQAYFVAACPFDNVVNIGNITCSLQGLNIYLPYYLNSVKQTLTPGPFYCSITHSDISEQPAYQWFCFEPHYSVSGIRMNGFKWIGLTPWQASNLNNFMFYVGQDTDSGARHSYAGDSRFTYFLWRYSDEDYAANWYMSPSGYSNPWYPFFDMHLTQGQYGPESESYNWVFIEAPTYLKQYTCPFVLSADPALSFERSIDSRNNNSYCYKVYYGVEVATVSNTGGSIRVYIYIGDTPELITLTLNSDSDTTYTTLSNGGRVYWDGITHGQVTDGCIVYEQPGATWGSWEGFGPSVGLHPTAITPTYYSTSAGGGMYRYFGWRGSDSITAYGKLTNYIDIDGTIRKFEDSSAQSFTRSNPIYDSVRIQDPVSGDEHIANLVYSKLEWGYSSYNLEFVAEHGTMPQIIVYVEKQSGYGGTLTGATATLSGQTYTSSVVEDGKIKFTLPNDGNFTVTSITTSNSYTLLSSDTISATYGTQTCYITTLAPITPMFKQQTVGGGARLQAGWYPGGSGETFYGKMSITASVDGVVSTRTDNTVQTFSSWHYFSYPIMTPTSERVVEIISSRLEWGLSADNLDRVSEWHE